MPPHPIAAALSLGLVCTFSAAQQLAVGDPAPPIEAASWIGWAGDAPSLESLRGRVVMLEFWGTWCGPCVRAMPGVQKLHDRYRDRGLTVLAISYEPVDTLRTFVGQHAYSMPVGSDVAKKTITAYGVRGWPTTIVIDKEGKVAHVGSPYDAEVAVERALGLEAGPAALLNGYLDAQAGARSSDEVRAALERLLEKAPPDFDLRAWAASHCPAETVPEGSGEGGGAAGAPPAAPGRAPKGGDRRMDGGVDGGFDGGELLDRVGKLWSNPEQRGPVLRQLADAGPSEFDLAAFAQRTFAVTCPFELAELKTMLHDKRYAGVVDAIAQRAPKAPVLAAAAKDKGLVAFCEGQAAEARSMAKKGLMAQLWVFPGALPRDKKVNDAFWGELSVSGMATSSDNKSITGLLLGGEMVTRAEIAGFVDDQLGRALVMDSLGDGKPPKLRSLDAQCGKERDQITRELVGRYGKPQPIEPPRGR